MSDQFGRRLKDLVAGVRAAAVDHQAARAGDTAAARARRRHVETAVMEETRRMLREAEGVFSGMGLRPKFSPEEAKVEAIPGARLPEAFPPWLLARCRTPAMEDSRVAVLEVTWRVDDPRTPLPEAPSVLRLVVADDSPAGMADVRDFLAVAIEDFAAAVARFDALMQS